jgi:uncharacterized protein YcbK (DUF882 family)
MEYFSIDEFRCKCCNELPKNGMNQILLDKLDDMRGRIGAPIIVTCGYRCPEHNAEVGGVSNSQHVLGNAADIYCDSLSVDELAGYCVEEGFDGIGRYYNSEFVHCDVRDNGDSPNYYTWTDQD